MNYADRSRPLPRRITDGPKGSSRTGPDKANIFRAVAALQRSAGNQAVTSLLASHAVQREDEEAPADGAPAPAPDQAPETEETPA
jgi:hypothetical protein